MRNIYIYIFFFNKISLFALSATHQQSIEDLMESFFLRFAFQDDASSTSTVSCFSYTL